jgi:hypothetical protein
VTYNDPAIIGMAAIDDATISVLALNTSLGIGCPISWSIFDLMVLFADLIYKNEKARGVGFELLPVFCGLVVVA